MSDSVLTLFHQLHGYLDYDPTTGHFEWRAVRRKNAYKSRRAGCAPRWGCTRLTLNGKSYRGCHLAWLYMYGEWPITELIHINGDRSDDRITNLRPSVPHTPHLTHDMLLERLHYNPTTGHFTWRVGGSGTPIGATAGTRGSAGYIMICVNRRSYPAHRLAWFYMYRHWPNAEIDHIDGVRDNNAISNLRDVSRSENQRNQYRCRKSKSGALGVHWSAPHKAWRVAIHIDGRTRTIGLYKDIEEAKAARKEANKKHGYSDRHGEQVCPY